MPNSYEIWCFFCVFGEDKKEETNRLVELSDELSPSTDYRVIGQLFNSFILIQESNNFQIVDQSRAHERILFEEIQTKLNENAIETQNLIFPSELAMPLAEIKFLENSGVLEKSGFNYEVEDEKLILNGIPVYAVNQDFQVLIDELLEGVRLEQKEDESIHQHIALSLAKNLKIKKGKKLEKQEMEKLMEDLFETETPLYSPRGKQTIVSFSPDQLSNLFQ